MGPKTYHWISRPVMGSLLRRLRLLCSWQRVGVHAAFPLQEAAGSMSFLVGM